MMTNQSMFLHTRELCRHRGDRKDQTTRNANEQEYLYQGHRC